MMTLNPLAMIAQALQPTPDAPKDPNIEDQFQSEWSQAQDFYNRRLQAGDIDPSEADSIYLAPVRAKYGMIASSPDLQDDPKKLAAFNTDYQRSLDSFNAANKRNEIGDSTSQIYKRTLQPTLEKQSVLSALQKANDDAYENDVKQVLNGAELQDINLNRLKPSQFSSLMSAYRLKHPPQRKKSPLEILLGDDADAASALGTGSPALQPSPSTNSGIKIISIKKVP